MSGKNSEKPNPGPEPERLKLEGDWKDRLAQAVEKRRPKGGWPWQKPAQQPREPVWSDEVVCRFLASAPKPRKRKRSKRRS